jgi:GDPmannose 4,6-dehydratase
MRSRLRRAKEQSNDWRTHMPKTAFVTGITGQDGAYLSKALLDRGYKVIGAFRRSSDLNLWRLKMLGIADEVELVSLEMLEFCNILKAIEQAAPDEIYNLAAQSFVGSSFDQPIYTFDANGLGTVRLLEAIRIVNPEIRFYQASTSELFGLVQEDRQSERTPFYPRSPYGISKLCAHWTTVNYREAYGLHACSGILFNHESPLRGQEFVTRKITTALANIVSGEQEFVELGNLNAKRDWGHARDYVEAMWLMLQKSPADDYVIGTGETHTIRDFVELASRHLDWNIEWRGEGVNEEGIETKSNRTIVKVNPAFYRPAEVETLTADPRKANEIQGWRPKTSLPELVTEMMESDLKHASRRCGEEVRAL